MYLYTPFFELSIHDLTRRSTAEQYGAYADDRLSIHDLTRRSTAPEHCALCKKESFNSRPHEEVDPAFMDTFSFRSLSIHDLTRRSTVCIAVFLSAGHSFNSRPHEEVDR